MDALDLQIRRRAGDVCEYCRFPQSRFRARFVIDHIIAKQHGGKSAADNLALCCPRCNRYKGPNIAGLDPLTGQLTRLFHPRQDKWPEHFSWRGVHLVGTTSVGRTTVMVLNLNHPSNLAVREQLVVEGVLQLPQATPGDSGEGAQSSSTR